MIVMNLVARKAGAKHELLFNQTASAFAPEMASKLMQYAVPFLCCGHYHNQFLQQSKAVQT
jgi:UDP-2,3-diacylglucosamine pyrophosphatase LpxH